MVPEVLLDDALELDNCEVNFRRIYGSAGMDAVLGSVDGRMRFFGLTPTSSKLEQRDRHRRPIDSYKKMWAVRGPCSGDDRLALIVTTGHPPRRTSTTASSATGPAIKRGYGGFGHSHSDPGNSARIAWMSQ